MYTYDMLPGYISAIFSFVCAIHFAQAERDPTPYKKMRWAKSFFWSNMLGLWIGYYFSFVIIQLVTAEDGEVCKDVPKWNFETKQFDYEMWCVPTTLVCFGGVISPVIGSLIVYYFYLCLKSYAETEFAYVPLDQA